MTKLTDHLFSSTPWELAIFNRKKEEEQSFGTTTMRQTSLWKSVQCLKSEECVFLAENDRTVFCTNTLCWFQLKSLKNKKKILRICSKDRTSVSIHSPRPCCLRPWLWLADNGNDGRMSSERQLPLLIDEFSRGEKDGDNQLWMNILCRHWKSVGTEFIFRSGGRMSVYVCAWEWPPDVLGVNGRMGKVHPEEINLFRTGREAREE